MNALEIRIREALKKRKMKVIDLARELKVSRAALYHLFKGNFSREMLSRISDTLGIPPHALLAPEGVEISPHHEKMIEAYNHASTEIRATVDEALGIAPGHLANRPLVFVVDDLEDNVALLRRCLRNDFEVMEFTDPKAALEAAKSYKVQMVISDQRMPGMTGTEFLSKLGEVGKPVGKILVSAYSDNEALMDAINESRVDAFLLKPVKPDLLRDYVRKTLLRKAETESAPIH